MILPVSVLHSLGHVLWIWHSETSALVPVSLLALHLPARLEVGFLQRAPGCVLGSQGTENLHIAAHHLLIG